ncbi:conjugal transfer protein MobC [Chryseosolibacter indicus]|uniref:Type IV secretory system conjugative DNA transfer family protein n=1 Tax=Chryseosolibacter indicus TaxID=2782351 RepID=A0ABS5VXR9_9BACT|nr:conjugal transfer protein MobC [Chryseosolibacter indicus]MBT1705863.1 type IV secretory system conjugative DNA transfer family protein [Chryseosolibacter indicus]
MTTGENDQGLRKILDLTRLLSISILLIHFYINCYNFFDSLDVTHEIINQFALNLLKFNLFQHSVRSKLAALLLLIISLVGAKGKKDESVSIKRVGAILIFGTSVYLVSTFVDNAILYMTATSTGYLLMLMGGTQLSRLVQLKLGKDIFNKVNQSFPQEERLIENEYSVNLPTIYVLKNQVRKGWINVVNPFRATLVIGTPGAGKSYFVIRHVITQHIKKGFTMFLYDYKYDDLSRIAYNALLKHHENYPIPPKFYVINFDKINHRCNPLEPSMMFDVTDATESSRTIMLGLNREWIKRQGDFFVESPINFVTAIIWFLKKYKDGKYCTLPHVIELMQIDYDSLFSVLRTEPEIEVLINPFVSAYTNDAMDQVEGQIGSAKICMARLSSPQLYYVLSGNDFTLDVNNPKEPKVVCVGNNPQKQQIYGAVLSLYISRMTRLVNRKHQQKCSLVFDEWATIYNNGIDGLMATARSNKVATTIGIQDYSQLKKDYGREQAEVVMNIAGNIISGQVVGDTAKQLSDRFGKIVQQRESISINSSDTSISRSTQLESAIPPSAIATLSSGEFVGLVADNPEERINHKIFHCEIVNDHKAIAAEENSYIEIPNSREITHADINANYNKIKSDVRQLVKTELENMRNHEHLARLIVKK